MRSTPEEIKTSEEHFLRLYEEAPLPYQSLDEEGRILSINRAWEETLGYTREEVLGQSIGEFHAPGQEVKLSQTFAEFLASGLVDRVKILFQCKDGTEKLFSINGRIAHDGQGHFLRTHCILTDITDIQKTEVELLQKNAELRLLDTIPAPVYVMDRQLRYQSVNQAFLAFMEMSAEQIIGKTDAEIFPPNTARGFESSDYEVIDDGRVFTDLEQAVPDPSGAIRWFSTTKTPVFNADGAVTGLVGVSFEITEQKLAQERRLDEEKNHRETLIREVHHRIKNHLQGVIGLLHNLSQSDLPAEETLNKAISQIRSIATVYGLQSDTGGGHIKISELILASLNVYRNTRPTHIVLEVDEVCSMELNREESIPVALVINELITNAIKHASPPPGKQPVVIEFGTTDSGVRLQIRNHGKDIPQDLDLDKAATLGTGLKIVRSLLPTKGAKLSLGSESGYVVAELLLEPPVIWSSRESQ
ncbi:MAG: PAS domain S-box protein [gamma proteobacterium endosymbiont of Lamellibrachia anaximandri]|nr:PAS domain S-box protein [gamma proteobacterium endosymbiont of Lamellibrachia anaximandri]MBL3535150.1 PAS domain S-box protein [gamma proteobacterium endosymbiont of Lamellibrachia anaximandri]